MTSPSIPINSLLRHIEPLQGALTQAANEVVGSGHFVLGRRVAAFEAEFAAYCGAEHCIGVANGTDALELALKGVGVTTGDRVVVAANAAMYATSAVLACGAEPVFADTLPDDATLDPAAVEAVLRTGPALKALIATHLYGRLARMRELVALCRAHGMAVIEDCAQAHGARSADGVRAGALGDIASFSFYPTKNLGAIGDGGAVVCRDAELAARVRQLRQYGWAGKYVNALPGGRNSRLDEIQAAMLSAMLPSLDGWNQRRRAVANRYSTQIRNAAIATPAAAGDDYVAHLYVIRSDRRDELREHLAAAGVQTDIHYPTPDHRQPCHAGRYAGIDLPHTQRDAEQVLTLPCFPEMTDDEVSRVIQACNRF